MIIFNKEWLANERIQEQAEKAFNLGEINTEEVGRIKEAYPHGFYTPNLFIRIGLLILTLIIASFSGGLISLVLMDFKAIESPGYLLFLGILTYAALEVIVREKHHFRSGADDALIWTSAGLLLTGCLWSAEDLLNRYEELAVAGFVFILGLYYTLRFADVLMAMITTGALAAIAFFLWKNMDFYAMQTMPFLMITAAIILYIYFHRLEHYPPAVYYQNCLQVSKLISLLLFYAAGNYFVVREIGAEMNTASHLTITEIPMAWFFWMWTFLIPVFYISWGIRKRDVLILRTGMVLVAIAGFTLKNYYHIMSGEALLTIIGAVLVFAAYMVIRYLKTPKHGLTSEEVSDGNVMDKIQVESLIVAETLSPVQGPDPGRFGGGSFGGGGSSGDF